MQILQHDDYLALREGGKVIEKDGHGDKVIILADGTFLKLFRRKRLISSAAIWPYAQRFADNAAKLKQLGIPCPEIIAVYRIPSIERDAVHYHPLPGLTLRQLRDGKADYPEDIREQFFAFVEKVQDLGVYFRSMHLGNVVLTPEGELGLIDISDMRIKKAPLSKGLRKRNWLHILRDNYDKMWLDTKHDPNILQ
jgi:RIO-like serine/threonine protein kinase